jgi:hypothetical protein
MIRAKRSIPSTHDAEKPKELKGLFQFSAPAASSLFPVTENKGDTKQSPFQTGSLFGGDKPTFKFDTKPSTGLFSAQPGGLFGNA